MYYLVFLNNPAVRYNGMEFPSFETACDHIIRDIKPDIRVVPRPRADIQEYYSNLRSLQNAVQPITNQ